MRPVGPHEAPETLPLQGATQVPSFGGKAGQHLLENRLVDDDGVLAGTGGGIVERLALDDLMDGIGKIRGLVDDADRIAGPDTVRGGTARVGRLHHGGAARGDDEVHGLHQLRVVGIDGSADAARGPRGGPPASDLAHELADQRGSPFGGRVRGEDDRVPALEHGQAVAADRRRRIGHRRKRPHDADRLGELEEAPRRSSSIEPHRLHAWRSRSVPSVFLRCLRTLSS